MTARISARLKELIDQLPLRAGARVLEIGCGTGAATREVCSRTGDTGFLLAIDRSAKAIEQAKTSSSEEITRGRMRFLKSAIEDFDPREEAHSFDIVFAVRVGVLDGRHPEKEEAALLNIRKALKAGGSLYVERAGKWFIKTWK